MNTHLNIQAMQSALEFIRPHEQFLSESGYNVWVCADGQINLHQWGDVPPGEVARHITGPASRWVRRQQSTAEVWESDELNIVIRGEVPKEMVPSEIKDEVVFQEPPMTPELLATF